MANKFQEMSNLFNASVPSVAIQRVLLETGATENRFTKDPHFNMPDKFVKQPKTIHELIGDTLTERLKVTLTLSIQGFKKRNLKNDPLKNIFDNLDIMSLVNTTVYEIGKESINNVAAIQAAGSVLVIAAGGTADYDISSQEIFEAIQAFPDFFNKKQFNLLEEMTSLTNNSVTDLSRYESIAADGSIIYNFPIKMEPYSYATKDPEFLAYMTVTEIDSELLLTHIKSTIGALADFELPTEVEGYIKNINSDISNKQINFDVIFNNYSINEYGALLLRDDNKQFWFGPYHVMDDGTVMTGNKHNDLSMPAQDRNILLTSVLLPNTKIVDLRDDEEIEKILLKELYQLEKDFNQLLIQRNNSKLDHTYDKVEKPETFSFSLKSITSSGAPAYLLGLDKVKILMHNSLLAGIAENINLHIINAPNMIQVEVLKQVLDNTYIKSLRVHRKKIKTNKSSTNRLGTLNTEQENLINTILDADIANSYADVSPKEIATYFKNISGKFNNVNIEKLEGFNFSTSDLLEKQFAYFSFKDNLLGSNKTGDYEYSYELILEDGIFNTLNNKIENLIINDKIIKTYINFIDSNSTLYYDSGRDKFKKQAIDQTEFYDVNNNINDFLMTLTEIILLFNFKADISVGIENLYKISNSISGNYQGLLKLSSIADTFINKIQKISGLNTSALDRNEKSYHSDAIIQTFFKPNVGLKNAITINETLPDIANLDDHHVGYHYILPAMFKQQAATASPISLLEIPASTYNDMANLEFARYFIDDNSNNSGIGNISNPNKLRYFTPTLTKILNKSYSTANGGLMTNAPMPYTKNFDYYKPIILDILDYYSNKMVDKKYSSSEKDNIKKLINISGKYGIIFDDNIINKLGFLEESKSSKDPENQEATFRDTAKSGNQQSSENINLSGISFDFKQNPAEEYKENDAISEFNLVPSPLLKTLMPVSSVVENLLFEILSNIILGHEGKLPDLVEGAGDQGSPTSPISSVFDNMPDNIMSLPFCLQSLFVEYHLSSGLQSYLPGQTHLPFSVVKETPLSLVTLGWWWFNYGNIVEVKYIKFYDQIMNPVWAPLTIEDFNNTVGAGKRIICKLFKYENKSLKISNKNNFLDLPIFDEHFIIKPSQVLLPLPPVLLNTGLMTKQTLDGLAAYFGEENNMSSIINVDPEVVKTIKNIGSEKIQSLLVKEQITNLDLRSLGAANPGRPRNKGVLKKSKRPTNTSTTKKSKRPTSTSTTKKSKTPTNDGYK